MIVAGTTLFFIYESKKNELRKDVKTYRYSQALKSALQQLKEINAAANTDLYYQQISATVYQYIGNKFNVGLAQATIDLVKNKLEEKKLTEPLYNDLKTILETCEMARFAPIQSNVEKDLLLQKTKNTIIKLEEVL
ncbi:MAG: hypothetical protein IT239_03390 [Bacteroidia bacterium]|nr:hypothetical protein [Bacteroidia bacterium]